MTFNIFYGSLGKARNCQVLFRAPSSSSSISVHKESLRKGFYPTICNPQKRRSSLAGSNRPTDIKESRGILSKESEKNENSSKPTDKAYKWIKPRNESWYNYQNLVRDENNAKKISDSGYINDLSKKTEENKLVNHHEKNKELLVSTLIEPKTHSQNVPTNNSIVNIEIFPHASKREPRSSAKSSTFKTEADKPIFEPRKLPDIQKLNTMTDGVFSKQMSNKVIKENKQFITSKYNSKDFPEPQANMFKKKIGDANKIKENVKINPFVQTEQKYHKPNNILLQQIYDKNNQKMYQNIKSDTIRKTSRNLRNVLQIHDSFRILNSNDSYNETRPKVFEEEMVEKDHLKRSISLINNSTKEVTFVLKSNIDNWNSEKKINKKANEWKSELYKAIKDQRRTGSCVRNVIHRKAKVKKKLEGISIPLSDQSNINKLFLNEMHTNVKPNVQSKNTYDPAEVLELKYKKRRSRHRGTYNEIIMKKEGKLLLEKLNKKSINSLLQNSNFDIKNKIIMQNDIDVATKEVSTCKEEENNKKDEKELTKPKQSLEKIDEKQIDSEINTYPSGCLKRPELIIRISQVEEDDHKTNQKECNNVKNECTGQTQIQDTGEFKRLCTSKRCEKTGQNLESYMTQTNAMIMKLEKEIEEIKTRNTSETMNSPRNENFNPAQNGNNISQHCRTNSNFDESQQSSQKLLKNRIFNPCQSAENSDQNCQSNAMSDQSQNFNIAKQNLQNSFNPSQGKSYCSLAPTNLMSNPSQTISNNSQHVTNIIPEQFGTMNCAQQNVPFNTISNPTPVLSNFSQKCKTEEIHILSQNMIHVGQGSLINKHSDLSQSSSHFSQDYTTEEIPNQVTNQVSYNSPTSSIFNPSLANCHISQSQTSNQPFNTPQPMNHNLQNYKSNEFFNRAQPTNSTQNSPTNQIFDPALASSQCCQSFLANETSNPTQVVNNHVPPANRIFNPSLATSDMSQICPTNELSDPLQTSHTTQLQPAITVSSVTQQYHSNLFQNKTMKNSIHEFSSINQKEPSSSFKNVFEGLCKKSQGGKKTLCPPTSVSLPVKNIGVKVVPIPSRGQKDAEDKSPPSEAAEECNWKTNTLTGALYKANISRLKPIKHCDDEKKKVDKQEKTDCDSKVKPSCSSKQTLRQPKISRCPVPDPRRNLSIDESKSVVMNFQLNKELINNIKNLFCSIGSFFKITNETVKGVRNNCSRAVGTDMVQTGARINICEDDKCTQLLQDIPRESKNEVKQAPCQEICSPSYNENSKTNKQQTNHSQNKWNNMNVEKSFRIIPKLAEDAFLKAHEKMVQPVLCKDMMNDVTMVVYGNAPNNSSNDNCQNQNNSKENDLCGNPQIIDTVQSKTFDNLCDFMSKNGILPQFDREKLATTNGKQSKMCTLCREMEQKVALNKIPGFLKGKMRKCANCGFKNLKRKNESKLQTLTKTKNRNRSKKVPLSPQEEKLQLFKALSSMKSTESSADVEEKNNPESYWNDCNPKDFFNDDKRTNCNFINYIKKKKIPPTRSFESGNSVYGKLNYDCS